MNEPITLIGIPQSTVALLQLVAKKLGKSMTDVLAEALEEKAKKHLKPDAPKNG